MTIKEVETLVGMTSANIRYYEKEGLITPHRNSSNNYRDYTEEDVQDLEKIKVLRVLGVTIQDIYGIMNGEKTLYDVMNCRLDELKEEAKKIEEVEKTCQYIVMQHMDYETMDSKTLNEKIISRTDLLREVLKRDIQEEYMTAKQMNRTIGAMMIYGYLLSAVISWFFGNYFREDLQILKDFANWETENHAWLFWGWMFTCWIIGMMVHCTSNLTAHMVMFQIVAFTFGPALNVFCYWTFHGKPKLLLAKEEIAVILFMMALYLLIVMLVGDRKEELFRSYGKMAMLSLVCSIPVIAVIYVMTDSLLLFIIVGIIVFMGIMFLGLGWVTANQEYSTYNRYHAYVSANNMMNVTAMICHHSGRNNANAFGRWGD